MSAKIGRTLSDIEKGVETVYSKIPSIYPSGSIYSVKRRGKPSESNGTRRTEHNKAALKRTEEIKIEAAINKLKKMLAANKIAKALRKNVEKHKSPSYKEGMYKSSRRALGNVKRSIRNTLSKPLTIFQRGGRRTRKHKRK